MEVHKNYRILYYFFDKSVRNTLQDIMVIVKAICKLLLVIQEYVFDLDSGFIVGGGGGIKKLHV
jgi:hypothetical protein